MHLSLSQLDARLYLLLMCRFSMIIRQTRKKKIPLTKKGRPERKSNLFNGMNEMNK